MMSGDTAVGSPLAVTDGLASCRVMVTVAYRSNVHICSFYSIRLGNRLGPMSTAAIFARSQKQRSIASLNIFAVSEEVQSAANDEG